MANPPVTEAPCGSKHVREMDCVKSGPMEIDLVIESSMDTQTVAMSELACPKTGAMKNGLILENIFRFCDAPTLKDVRFVCSEWRDLSLKFWRAKAMIQLSKKAKLVDYLNLPELEKHPFKRYYLEFGASRELGPSLVGEDHLDPRLVTDVIRNSGAQHVSIGWFFEKFTEFDTYLSAVNSDKLETLKVSWYTLEEDMPEAAPMNFPNIKRLNLFTSFLRSCEHTPERSLWRYLLRSFPKLEALSFGYKLEEENEDEFYPDCLKDRLAIANLLKSLRQQRREDDEEVIPLKELEMMDVFTNQNIYESESKEGLIIKALASCNFPLEKLSIHVGWHGNPDDFDTPPIPLLPLLSSCKNTLKILKTSINFNREYYLYTRGHEKRGYSYVNYLKPEKSSQICMEMLKEVRLLNGLEWAMFFLGHLKLPQLETLIVEYDKSRNPYQDRHGYVYVHFPRNRVYHGLHTFELHDNPCIPDQEMIYKFVDLMPNLVDLKIPLDKKTFHLICENFQRLRILHILGAQSDYIEIDDKALTGLSKCKRKLKKGEVASATRKPNITDLENLTDLKICCQRQLRRHDVKFTEHSVTYGFLQLPRLYYLSVAIKNISDEMKKKLLDHVKGTVQFQRKQKPPPGSFAVELLSTDDSSELEDEGENE